MNRITLRAAFGLAFALLLALVAACGDDETPEATSTATAAATAAPTTEATTAATAGGGATDGPVNATIGGFSLPTLTVPVGATVVWTNQDEAPHTATADGGEFSSPSLDQGASFEHTFEAAGSFPYACAIHPSMTATITVE